MARKIQKLKLEYKCEIWIEPNIPSHEIERFTRTTEEIRQKRRAINKWFWIISQRRRLCLMRQRTPSVPRTAPHPRSEGTTRAPLYNSTLTIIPGIKNTMLISPPRALASAETRERYMPCCSRAAPLRINRSVIPRRRSSTTSPRLIELAECSSWFYILGRPGVYTRQYSSSSSSGVQTNCIPLGQIIRI